MTAVSNIGVKLDDELPKIPQRVAAGFKAIREKWPDVKIDKSILKLDSHCRCVLGQIDKAVLHTDCEFGSFDNAGAVILGCKRSTWADAGGWDDFIGKLAEMGFIAPYCINTHDYREYYAALEAEWKRVLP